MTEDKVTFDANEFSATEATVSTEWLAGYEAAVAAAREAGVRLAAKSAALVESVYSDNANHGDILSRETIAAANALHIELGSWKK